MGKGRPDIGEKPGPQSVKKQEPVVKAGAGAGGGVALATALMAATNSLGWTNFTADDRLVIVAAVGIVAPVVAALVARMHVWARPRSKA